MIQVSSIRVVSERNSIFIELHDAALHAKHENDFRWLCSVAEVFLARIEKGYEPIQELTERWYAYNRKKWLLRLLIRVCGRRPAIMGDHKEEQEVSRLLDHARRLRKAALAKDLSTFFRLAHGTAEFEASDWFV